MIIGTLALLTSSLAVFTIRYNDLIYPNTYIGDTNFGGKTIAEAESMLSKSINQIPDKIPVIIDAEKQDEINKKDIALTFHSKNTAYSLYSVGRTGSLLENIYDMIASLISRNQRYILFEVDQEAVNSQLEQIAKKHGQPAEDAKIVLDNTQKPVIIPPKQGFGVTVSELSSALHTASANLKPEIRVKKSTLLPEISEEAAQGALRTVEKILAKSPVTISAENKSTTADTKQLFSWINYALPEVKNEQSGSLVEQVSAQANTKELQATLNETDIKAFLSEFATTVNSEPQNAQLEATDGQIKVTKEHRDGKRVKIDEGTLSLMSQLQDETVPPAPLSIEIPTEVVHAEIKSTNIQELGLKELIARAETTFKGSPANRIHNITVGARFLDGAIVPPGQEFSTVSRLGTVDGSTGYLPELVIKENRTTPEFGGGLCQVSTTLFRAVLNAGLKVTERHNHSYRVSYYEPPVGLDATIYLPKPDFKFQNDTPGYILIQSKVEGTKITFELYGTKDGRSSTVSEPVVTNITDPPPAIYVDTDTLKKGETKQIEKPHQGATAVVTYTVMKDGKEVHKQIFRSRYKAWAARYLVGTKEE